jgi:leucine dehydrogenase
MTRSLAEQLAAWDGEAVVVRHDRATDAWIFIALHDSTLGRPVGGTRVKIYPHPAAGLEDAQRLAAGMTAKWAAAGLPMGGGKAVLALSRPLETAERDRLLERYGRLVESLAGAFGTGQDLGTSPADMERIARHTRWVHGVGADGRAVDPGPFTARGVHAAVRAVLREISGSPDPAERTVLVEGVGGVGEPLARLLAADGARLVLADLDHDKARRLARELGAETVPLERVPETPCDVYAPCAVGATLNPETIPRLACRAVAGSANNQLATPDDARALAARGILWAPDFIANAGGAIAFGLSAGPGHDDGDGGGNGGGDEIARRLAGLETVLGEIFDRARLDDMKPLEAAEARARAALTAHDDRGKGPTP